MKKAEVTLIILMTLTLAGCGKAVSEESRSLDINDLQTLTDEGKEWGNALKQDGILTADINQDGQEDVIRIVCQELEGSMYITEFTIKLGGNDTVYSMEEEYYDASFEKLELLDVDGDGSREVLFLFDTHGGGGQGTHDIMMFDDNELLQISSSLEPALEIESEAYLDGIYYIEKVLYGEEERLLVRQYMYGEDGHSDGIGDIVSIVSLDSDTSSFIADVSWAEKY